MMKTFLIILCLCIYSLAITQERLVVQVVGEQNQSVAFATIFLKNHQLGTISDAEGYFELMIPAAYLKDTLLIDHLGFEAKQIPLTESVWTMQSFVLQQKINQINEAEVQGYKAETLLAEAIKNIDENYANQTHFVNGFYNQIHKEDGKYVRYIDAYASTKYQAYSRRAIDEQKIEFSILEMRRSFNFERNGDQHGDHLYDLLAENPLLDATNSILNESNLDLYEIVYASEFDSVGFEKLYFQNTSWNAHKNYTGSVVICKEDKAIVSLEIASFPNEMTSHENHSDWQFQNGVFQINFVKNEAGNYQLESCSKWYNHNIINKTFARVDYVVEEFFHWKTDHFLQPNKLTYAKHSNLYSREYDYHADFWKDREINSKIVEELSQQKTLEEQFENQ